MSTWTELVDDKKVMALMVYCLIAGVLLGSYVTFQVAYEMGFKDSDALNVATVEEFMVCLNATCVHECACFDDECFQGWINRWI